MQLQLETGESVRIRTMGSGTIVGELGMYLNTPASATVVADMPTITYFLSQEALEKIEEEDPNLATVFHKFMVRFLGQRLVYNHIRLKALLD